jgi:predicted porin
MMKKHVLVLAMVGAFSATASAQSSVTIYGLVDLNIMNTKAGSLRGGTNVTELADGVIYGPGSRWGLRVSEDLGGGLKANVVLESGFGADTGTQTQGASNLGVSSRLFGRQAFISLASANLGELRLGRQYALHDEALVLTNPYGNTTVLNPGTFLSTTGTTANARTGRIPLMIDAPRMDNAVQYISPDFAGIRLQAMVAAGEGQNNSQGGIVPRYQALKATYLKGPLSLVTAYDMNHGSKNTDKVWTVGGNYDFGRVKLLGGFQRARDLTLAGLAFTGLSTGTLTVPGAANNVAFTASKLDAYTVGAAMPFGATTLGVNYTRAKYEGAGNTADASVGRLGVGARYDLSKLTSLYAAAAFTHGDLKEAIQEKRIVQIGLRKAF